jgi:hypothetical protein
MDTKGDRNKYDSKVLDDVPQQSKVELKLTTVAITGPWTLTLVREAVTGKKGSAVCKEFLPKLKTCQGCDLKQQDYGLYSAMPSEGKKRWCLACGKAQGVVLLYSNYELENFKADVAERLGGALWSANPSPSPEPESAPEPEPEPEPFQTNDTGEDIKNTIDAQLVSRDADDSLAAAAAAEPVVEPASAVTAWYGITLVGVTNLAQGETVILTVSDSQ